MNFLREYILNLESQEQAVWKALEYLAIRGGAPLALVLYLAALVITYRSLPSWAAAVLGAGWVVVLLLVLLQRAAFHSFIRARRRECDEAENALIHHLNTVGATDSLRTVGASLGRLKAALGRF